MPVCPYCETLLTPTRTESDAYVMTRLLGVGLFLTILENFINDRYTAYLIGFFLTLSVVVLSWYYLVHQKTRRYWRVFDGTRRLDL